MKKKEIVKMIEAMRCRACRERVVAMKNDEMFKYSLLGRDIVVCDRILDEIERSENEE